jgi:hypothetical protein
MNKKIILSTALVSTLFAMNLTAASTEDRITALENEIKALKSTSSEVSEIGDRLEAVETSSMTDKIDFGLTFRTRYDMVDYGVNTIDDDKVFSTKLNLNMKSIVSEDIKFTGRLTAYETWGNNYPDMYASYNSKQGRTPTSTTVFMERAYVDYTAIKGDVPVTLTIGRQPSSDGPSWQFAENSVRKGTYDALLFDGAADGLVATVGLSKVVGNEGTALRFAYGKGVESEPYKNLTGSNAVKDNVVVGAFAETSIPGLSDSLVAYSYAKATDIVGDSNTGAGSKNLGDISWNGLLVEVPNLVTGLDVFAHYGKSKAEANGQTVNVNMNNLNMNVPMIDGNGDSYWLGARYAVTKNIKVGYEFNKGDKNWFSMTGGSNDPFNKLATRGSVNDVYATFNIAKATHVKVGHMQKEYDYTGSGYHIGTPMTVSAAGAVEKTKNTYVEFVVNF